MNDEIKEKILYVFLTETPIKIKCIKFTLENIRINNKFVHFEIICFNKLNEIVFKGESIAAIYAGWETCFANE